MHGWMFECIAWMGAWMDGCMSGQLVDWLVGACHVNCWLHAVDGLAGRNGGGAWMNGWVGEWMDG